MKVVRTILWALLAIVLVLFALANWLPVEVRIGWGLVLETRLPLLVIGAFLLGLVPTWIVHRVRMWRLERRTAELAGGHAPTNAGAHGHPDHSPAPGEPAPYP